MKLFLLMNLFWPHHVDWKFWSAIGGTGASYAADYVTSQQCQPRCTETNPMFGPHPSAARVAAVGGAFFAGETLLAHWMRNNRRAWLRRTWWIVPEAEMIDHARLAQHNAGLP